jgi:hypothetical protein
MGRGVEASRIRDSTHGPGAPRDLARELTLPAATALVVGQVVAVGIFLTPGTIIRTLASPVWVLAVWALIGGMAVCGALCYGALAARRGVWVERWPSCTGGSASSSWTRASRRRSRRGWRPTSGYMVPLGGRWRCASSPSAPSWRSRSVHVVGVKPGARLLIDAGGAEDRAGGRPRAGGGARVPAGRLEQLRAVRGAAARRAGVRRARSPGPWWPRSSRSAAGGR